MEPSFGTDLNAAFGIIKNITPQIIKPVSQETKSNFDTKLFNQKFEYEQQRLMQPQPQVATKQIQEPSYLDKMALKKRDVLKLLIMSMMIIVAISIHTFIDFWLKDIVSAYQLTYRQELGLRALYPIAIILLIWNTKASLIK